MSDFHAGARECCEHWPSWFELFSVATRATERKRTHNHTECAVPTRGAAAPSACCALTARVSERSAVQLDARRCTPTALRTGYARAMLRCPSAHAPATRARSRRSGPAPTRVRAASPLRRGVCSRAHACLCSFAFARGRVRAFARVVPCMRRCVCVQVCARERVRRRAFVRYVCALMCAHL